MCFEFSATVLLVVSLVVSLGRVSDAPHQHISPNDGSVTCAHLSTSRSSSVAMSFGATPIDETAGSVKTKGAEVASTRQE